MSFGDFDNYVPEEPEVEQKKEKKKSYTFDLLNDIYHKKDYIFDDVTEGDYKPYLINRWMSGNHDTVLFAQEMNQRHELPKKLQFDFYFHYLRPKKRFSKWLRRSKDEDVEALMSYYNYNRRRAQEILKLHSVEKLNEIKQALETGGKTK